MDGYSVVDREALISHLYDVRALELTKQKISAEIEMNTGKINTLGYKSTLKKPSILPKIIISFFAVLCGVVIFFLIAGETVFLDSITDTVHTSLLNNYDGIYLYSSVDYNGHTYIIPKQPEFMRYIIIAVCTAVLLAVIAALISAAAAFKKRSEYKRQKSLDDNRVAEEQKRKEILIRKNEQHVKELKELNSVLNQNYSVNIIPGQFRNVEGICYLYDYLSTSHESFQSALINFNMNKLNINMQKMVQAQSNMLIQQYITNAKLTDMKKQNKELLNRLYSIEQNTELAAKYAAMNEANTSTIAFFKGMEFFSGNH